MDKKTIIIKEREARDRAEEHFFQCCGVQGLGDDFTAFYEEGLRIRDNCLAELKISAVFSGYIPQIRSGSSMRIGGKDIEGEVFKRMSLEKVDLVYPYMITVNKGKGIEGDRHLMYEYLVDLWETAYLYAGIDLVRAEVLREAKRLVENGVFFVYGFAPGHYGMDLGENRKIDQILNGAAIGISVLDTGAMQPLKSCSGIFGVSKESLKWLPGFDIGVCKDCLGSPEGCVCCLRFTTLRHEQV
ncbi:MAG: hypothetical protein ACOX4U_05055 [Anaerovoracaceae bacterium]|jgi:hypothetical protein